MAPRLLTAVAGLETELTTVRGSLTEVQRDQEATAARLAGMTATAQAAESRATAADATAAAATERAERAESQVQTVREKVETLRGELSAERDRAGAATSQVAVLAIERDNALAAAVREREYADQRVADLRATYDRGEPGPENINEPSTATKAAVTRKTAKTKTRTVGKVDP